MAFGHISFLTHQAVVGTRSEGVLGSVCKITPNNPSDVHLHLCNLFYTLQFNNTLVLGSYLTPLFFIMYAYMLVGSLGNGHDSLEYKYKHFSFSCRVEICFSYGKKA